MEEFFHRRNSVDAQGARTVTPNSHRASLSNESTPYGYRRWKTALTLPVAGVALALAACSPSTSSSSAAGSTTPGTSASTEAPIHTTSSPAVNGPFPAPTTQGGLQQLVTFEVGYYADQQELDAAAPYRYVKINPSKPETFKVTTPGGTSSEVGYSGTLFPKGDKGTADAIQLIVTDPDAEEIAKTIAKVASGAEGNQELAEMAGKVVKVEEVTKGGTTEEIYAFDATKVVITPKLIENFS